MTNLITPRALFSPIFLQSSTLFHESGLETHSRDSFELFQDSGHSIRWPPKPWHRIIHEVDRMTYCWDMAIWNFPRWRPAATGNSVIRSTDPKNSTPEPKWCGLADLRWRYRYLKFSKWEASQSSIHRKDHHTWLSRVNIIHMTELCTCLSRVRMTHIKDCLTWLSRASMIYMTEFCTCLSM